MADVVSIWNRALQKLGASRVESISDDSRNARSCQVAWDPVRQAELRSHNWNFSIKRFQLAASSDAPLFGYTNAFPLPTGYLKLLPWDPADTIVEVDWQIENGYILTNDDAPLNVRCVCDVEDPNLMDALFREGVATKMSLEMCEEITQSNTKKAALDNDYELVMRKARRANAFENMSQESPDGSWITARV